MINNESVRKSSKKTVLQKLAKAIQRPIDRAEGWGNGNPEKNGEYWLLQHVVPRSNIVIDVGANIGDWTAECLKLNRNLEIFAFEASPETADAFDERYASCSNVHLIRCALGEENGQATFCNYGRHSGLSGLYSRERSVGRVPIETFEVTKCRLDSVNELDQFESLDFVKIDTEGAELDILYGSRSWFDEKRISLLQFEYGGAWIDARHFLADAYRLLTGHGYMFGRLLPRSIRWIDSFDHRDLETFKYANFVACSSPEKARYFDLLD